MNNYRNRKKIPKLIVQHDFVNNSNQEYLQKQPKKVFISWSGNKSLELAYQLNSLIDKVFGEYIEVYLSKKMQQGTRWSDSIQKALNEADLGLIILTSDNIGKHWLLFEAGAISSNATIIPILFDRALEDLEKPLGQYQVSLYNKTNSDNTTNLTELLKSIKYHLGLQIPDILIDLFAKDKEKEFYSSIEKFKDIVLNDFKLTINQLTVSSKMIYEKLKDCNNIDFDLIIGINHGGVAMANHFSSYFLYANNQDSNKAIPMGYVHLQRTEGKYEKIEKLTHFPEFTEVTTEGKPKILLLDAKCKSGGGQNYVEGLLKDKYPNCEITIGVAINYINENENKELVYAYKYEGSSDKDKIEEELRISYTTCKSSK